MRSAWDQGCLPRKQQAFTTNATILILVCPGSSNWRSLDLMQQRLIEASVCSDPRDFHASSVSFHPSTVARRTGDFDVWKRIGLVGSGNWIRGGPRWAGAHGRA